MDASDRVVGTVLDTPFDSLSTEPDQIGHGVFQ